jgi:amyloid beta precursor protein binding protein 1
MTEIVASQTPPILHGPSEKEKKYDRQLRLWAASGQAALESANILLVNSGAGCVGVEALKNLVLPGSHISISSETSLEHGMLTSCRYWQIHYRR